MKIFDLFVLAICLVLLSGCKQSQPSLPPLTHVVAEDITGTDYGRDFDLMDVNGRHLQLRDFYGKVVVIFFGYTHCPDVCPTTLYDMSLVMKMLGQDADKVQVLFVTVDPERDTPALLAKYVPAFYPSFLGLYTDARNTEVIARQFGVYFHQQAPDIDGRYAIDHSAFSYVYDRYGHLRLKIPFAQSPADIGNDLKQLLRQ